MSKTIHIFAYGEAQIISKDVNYKTSVSNFTKLQAVIDNIKSLKPADVNASDYHAINIFENMKVAYLSKEKKQTYNVEFNQIDKSKYDELVAEFESLKASAPEQKNDFSNTNKPNN